MKSDTPTGTAVAPPVTREGLCLRVVVFMTGASIMGLEMVGVRLLEPYLGSTHYVWGAIIGIFLGALSIGYFAGGRLADRYPTMRMPGYILLLSAAWIFCIPYVSVDVGSALANVPALSPQARAVLGGMILYAVPSVLLGMISPFAVRLAAETVAGMGRVAGGLYALGTLGAITGTFLVSFVLTEWVGSRNIVWGIAVTLVLIALLCFRGTVRHPRVAAAVALSVLVAWMGHASLGWAQARVEEGTLLYPPGARGIPDGARPDTHLLTRESVYHQIAVVESDYNLATREWMTDGRRARYMKFNTQYESGILVEADGSVVHPVQSTCGYINKMHIGVLFTERAPRRVVMIGGGGGVGSQNVAEDYAGTVQRIDVVDIDPVVLELAASHFDHPPVGDTSGVIRSHAADGRLFLKRATDPYDYVILDAYTSGGQIPRHLITREFFELTRERMTPDGVLVCNIISSLEGHNSRLVRSVYKTLRTVYPQVYVFPRQAVRGHPQNVYLVATRTDTPLTLRELDARFNRHRDTLLRKPDLRDTLRNLLPPGNPFGNLDAAPLLTDDYCPTDGMMMR